MEASARCSKQLPCKAPMRHASHHACHCDTTRPRDRFALLAFRLLLRLDDSKCAENAIATALQSRDPEDGCDHCYR